MHRCSQYPPFLTRLSETHTVKPLKHTHAQQGQFMGLTGGTRGSRQSTKRSICAHPHVFATIAVRTAAGNGVVRCQCGKMRLCQRVSQFQREQESSARPAASQGDCQHSSVDTSIQSWSAQVAQADASTYMHQAEHNWNLGPLFIRIDPCSSCTTCRRLTASLTHLTCPHC